LSGYVVDDYVLGGTVTIYGASGAVVATTKSVDFGYFSANVSPGQNYKVVISGGVQDIDGLASTSDDQRPNTATLIALSPADAQGKPVVVSAISTGIAAYAGNDASKYLVKAAAIEAALPGAMYLSSGTKPDNALRGLILATENSGGFTNLVSELADDGDLNGSSSVSAKTLSQATALVASLDGTGIADPALLSCVWSAFPSDPGHLSQSLLDTVTELHCGREGIKSLQGITQLRNLETADFSGNSLTNAKALAGLSKLTHISLADNYLRDLDVSGLADSAYVLLSGNCLSSSSVMANNVNLLGATRRQKSPDDCMVPRVSSLRAIARDGSALEISYKVQDVQSLPCELEVLGQKKSISCDGNVHVLRLSQVVLKEKTTELVKLNINGKLAESTPIEFYSKGIIATIRATTTLSSSGPGIGAATVPTAFKICIDYSTTSQSPTVLSSNAKCSAPGQTTAQFDIKAWKPASSNIVLHAFFVNSSNDIISWTGATDLTGVHGWVMRPDGTLNYSQQDVCAGTTRNSNTGELSCNPHPGVVSSLPGYITQGGLTWTPASSPDTWANANAFCARTINGQTGWRLPTVNELIGLAYSGAMFGQHWIGGDIWSSTVGSGSWNGLGTHFYVFLSDGNAEWASDSNHYVSCVR
jgi:hypothetical protein